MPLPCVEAQTAYDDGAEALKNGDFAAYGAAQARLARALEKAAAAQQEIAKATGEPVPTASAEATTEGGDATTAQAPPDEVTTTT